MSSTIGKYIIQILGATELRSPSAVEGNHYYLENWPFPSKTAAITLGSIILHRDPDPTNKIMYHEEAHVYQNHRRAEINKDRNMFKWYLSYLWESIKEGYYANKYERAARKYAEKYINK